MPFGMRRTFISASALLRYEDESIHPVGWQAVYDCSIYCCSAFADARALIAAPFVELPVALVTALYCCTYYITLLLHLLYCCTLLQHVTVALTIALYCCTYCCICCCTHCLPLICCCTSYCIYFCHCTCFCIYFKMK
jgi:hypothetical protein